MGGDNMNTKEEIKNFLKKQDKTTTLKEIYLNIKGTPASIRGQLNLMTQEQTIIRVERGSYKINKTPNQ